MYQKFESVDEVKEALAKQGFAIGHVHPVDYHEWKKLLPNAVSKSSLCEYMENPYAYHYNKQQGNEKTTTALRKGSLIDMLALTPELADDSYTTEVVNRRTKEGKARAAEIESLGLTLISPEELSAASIAAKAAMASINSLVGNNFETQVAMWLSLTHVLGAELATPLTVTGMLDVCTGESLPLVDLKSTSVSLSEPLLNKNMATYSYGIQAALYKDLFEACTGEQRDFSFVFVGVNAPYQTRVIDMNPCDIPLYRDRYCRGLQAYAVSVKNNDWGSQELPRMTYEVPKWEGVNK